MRREIARCESLERRSLLSVATPLAVGDGGTVTLQAEAATMSGARAASDHPGYTGAGFADYLSNSGGFIEWSVDVPVGGAYALSFRYANGAARERALEMTVSGTSTRPLLRFAPTGSWRTWQELSTAVTLPAGRSTIRLTTIGGNGPNVDSMTLRPPSTQTLQAESARLSGPSAQSQHPGYTGAGYADYVHATGDFVEWTVNVPQAGDYDFGVRYANGGSRDRPLALAVNGQGTAPRLSFAPTGAWTNWQNATARATLRAGVNVVRLLATGASGPNIDSITVGPHVVAPPGTLDDGFDGDGRQFTGFGSQGGGGDVIVAPDGKILTLRNTAGRYRSIIVVSRVNPDGSFDESFGQGMGSASVPQVVPPEGAEIYGQGASAMAVQRDRKILIAGHSRNETRGVDFLMRLRENGTVDTTFGGGDGIVTFDGDSGPARGLAVADDGDILVARGHLLLSLKSDGSPDLAFGGGDGVAEMPQTGDSPTSFHATGLTLGPGGNLYVLGDGVDELNGPVYAVARIRSDGIDTAFATERTGPDGRLDVVNGIAIGPAGEVYLAGRSGTAGGSTVPGRFSVLQIPHFGNSTSAGFGMVSVGPGGPGAGYAANDLLVQRNGGIVAAGDAGGGYNVVRFNPDGSLDRTFGAGGADGDGVVTTAFELQMEETLGAPFGVAIQGDGKIVAAGSVNFDDAFTSSGHVALARYFGDPVPQV